VLHHKNPVPAKADDWDEDDYEEWDSEFFYGDPTAESCEVFESDDEPQIVRSPILGPDGQPIYYEIPSSKLGYIGFIPPSLYLAIRKEQALRHLKRMSRKKRKRKNASSKKSKA
jgi:hypothetical protein